MPGIVAMVGKWPEPRQPHITFRSIRPLVINSKAGENYFVQHFVNSKFQEDKVFYEDLDVLIALDGAILNMDELRRNSRSATNAEAIKKAYVAGDSRFFKSFRGEFSGLLYDKQSDKWIFFTNHVGSKSLFYYRDADLFVCASELKVVTQLLRKAGRRCTLDEAGAYMLLTYGFMLEDYTLVSEVKRLRPGHCIEVSPNSVRVESYYALHDSPAWPTAKGKIIDTLEDLFRQAVGREYQKDVEYGYRHIATLSGGLDSRMAVIVAHELGYRDVLDITCSESGYLDQTIASRIAADLHDEFLAYALDNGTYLLDNMNASITANDGLALWGGAAHACSLWRKLDFTDYGIIHMGQIGDAVMGSFVTSAARQRPTPGQGAYSRRLLPKISDILQKIVAQYESEELFLFNNRAFNGAFNGNWTAYQFSECASPFLDVDFLDYALRVPRNLKLHEKLYREWICAKHPRAARYVWEKTKSRLSASTAEAYIRRQLWRVMSRIAPRRFIRGMNPLKYWYKNNVQIQESFLRHYRENLSRIDAFPALKADCDRLFNGGAPLEKTQVMTLLEAVKLHLTEETSTA